AILQLADRLLRYRTTLHVKAVVDAFAVTAQIGDHETAVDAMSVDLDLCPDPPRARPNLGLIILDHFKALHFRLAVPVELVVAFQVTHSGGGALFEYVVAAITKGI